MAGSDDFECDTTYGNVSQGVARQMAAGAVVTVPGPYLAGATEPWITELVGSLCKAVGAHTVLETGSFCGHTTAHLATCLARTGGGRLIACEIDPVRARGVWQRLHDLDPPGVDWDVRAQDVMQVIAGLPDGSLDFAFVDDDHTMAHVEAEILALWPKMRVGGLMTFHDVYGVCDLQRVVAQYGGYSLDCPRNGPAGGLGLLQR